MLDYKCPASPSTGFNVCGLIERREPECELGEGGDGPISLKVGREGRMHGS